MAEEAAKSRRSTMKDPFAVTAEGRTETLARLADAIAEVGEPSDDEAEEPAEETEGLGLANSAPRRWARHVAVALEFIASVEWK